MIEQSTLIHDIDESLELRTGHLTHKILSKYSASEVPDNKHIKLTQVRAATGFDDLNTADLMIMGGWPSSGNLLEGFEVKVSRADWLNEVKKPSKNDSVKSYCHKWWLVISDETMVKPGELPEDWGMMALRKSKLVVIKEAPMLTPSPVSYAFVASLLRHNVKEQIPIDVHNDKMTDCKREFEKVTKEKYGALLDYVKFLNTHLGIKVEIEENKEWRNGKYEKFFKGWSGKLKGGWNSYTPEKMVDVIKAALDKDLEQTVSDMKSIRRHANDLVTESDKLLGEVNRK